MKTIINYNYNNNYKKNILWKMFANIKKISNLFKLSVQKLN